MAPTREEAHPPTPPGSVARSEFPVFRRDLRVLPSPSGAFRVFDPQAGSTFELDEREFFLCGQLDGRTSPDDLRERFEKRFQSELSREELDAFLHVVRRQGLLVPDPSTVRIDPIGPQPGFQLLLPLPVDRILVWWTDRLRWCFTWAFALVAVPAVALGGGVLLKHWDRYRQELRALVDEPDAILWTVAAVLFMGFLQRLVAALATTNGGGRVRWFGVRFVWYFFPVFRCDLSDLAVISSRSRYRTIYAGALAQLVLAMITLTAWFSTWPGSSLHTLLLVFSAVLLFLLPLNPFGPRNAYYLVAAWTETPNLRSRSVETLWSWLSGYPAFEPLTRRQKWGMRLFGLGEVLYYGTLGSAIIFAIVATLVENVDFTGMVLTLVVAGFLLEFPLRRELMRFEPLRAWFARNDGTSPVAWVLRLGLLAIFVLVMFIPYPYEPSGSVRILPAQELGIRARVAGRIVEVLVDEGEWVDQGQIVVRLDARELRQDLEVAEAELDRTQSTLALLNTGAKPEEVARAREGVAAAEKRLYYTRREAERLRKLYEEEVVSLARYEEGLERRDVSKEAYDEARENLNMVTTGVKEETLDTQRADIARLETIIRHLEEDLELVNVRSPVSGYVTTPGIKARVGMELFVGDLVATVEDSSMVTAELEMPQQRAQNIEPGARVRVRAWAYPSREYVGKVVYVAPVVTDKEKEGTPDYLSTQREDAISRAVTSQEGRVVRVLVELDNDDRLLMPEMTGYGKVLTGTKPFGIVMTHGLVRFGKVEVWSWIP